MSQLELLGGSVPVEPGVKLTARQRYALEVIGKLQPVESDELGAYLHQERQTRTGGEKGHAADVRCEWCGTEGAQMGAALRNRRLVTKKRDAGWVLVGYKPTRAPEPAPEGLDEHGFPENF